MSSCYILFSKKLDRYYIGFTTLPIDERLDHHLSNYYDNKFTSKANDWIVFLEIKCPNADTARKVEAHIKRMKSKRYIENLKKYPEMVENLIAKYDVKHR